MTTPIKYETAKLLKEKGFDISVSDCYFKSKEFGENYSVITQYQIQYIDDIGDCLIIPYNSGDETLYLDKINFNSWSTSYSAPTIAEVVMWIFKEYNIWIYAMPLKSGNVGFSIWNSKTDEYELERVEYKSIQEAYEAGITCFLTEIIK